MAAATPERVRMNLRKNDTVQVITGRDAGSVSVHAYSPPLWRMGQYAVTGTGLLRRMSVSYAEELRPVSFTGLDEQSG